MNPAHPQGSPRPTSAGAALGPATAVALAFTLALTVCGTPPVLADVVAGPRLDIPSPPAPVPPVAGGCFAGVNSTLNSQAGLAGPPETQRLCFDTPPGDPGDLKGFAFPFQACMTGGIAQVWINFRIGDLGDPFFLYVWRDSGGLPADTCGLELYARMHFVEEPGLFSVFDLCDAMIDLEDDERFWIGVIYRNISKVFGPDWFIARNTVGGFVDHAYINESGIPGGWQDLFVQALGNRWGVLVAMADDCGPLPVEQSTWGAVKALMR